VIRPAQAILRYVSRKSWNWLARDLKQIYTARTQQAAREEFTPFLAVTTS
jgi:transposase-like protein